MIVIFILMLLILSFVEADVEDCAAFGKPCPPNQKCCMDGTACCTFIHLRPDIRKLTSEKFAIWNLWFFWFLTIFILMICTGICAYWRNRYRSRFFSARSFVWSALDPTSSNFSTATTLEPRSRHFPPVSWRQHRDFITNIRMPDGNPVFSSLSFIRDNNRLTLHPTFRGLNADTEASQPPSIAAEIPTFVPLPPSYAEAVTVVSDEDKSLPPPYEIISKPLDVHEIHPLDQSNMTTENGLLDDSPPPYHNF